MLLHTFLHRAYLYSNKLLKLLMWLFEQYGFVLLQICVTSIDKRKNLVLRYLIWGKGRKKKEMKWEIQKSEEVGELKESELNRSLKCNCCSYIVVFIQLQYMCALCVSDLSVIHVLVFQKLKTKPGSWSSSETRSPVMIQFLRPDTVSSDIEH